MSGQPVVLAVIPARYASTRFPGKVIVPLAGKPLVWHVYERARKARSVTDVIIATDDTRVKDALNPFDVPVVMTRPDHASGTDRIAEVVANRACDIVVNVQGDEPLIDPRTIDAVIEPLLSAPDLPMATAKCRIKRPEMVENPNVVKVVCDDRQRALYFSRSRIPYIRDEAVRKQFPPCYFVHIGLYAYRKDFLLKYSQWEPTPLERLEKLEQLRVLEHGYPIAVVETEYESVGVDTPEDLERVSALLAG